jgi:hypothetical protein
MNATQRLKWIIAGVLLSGGALLGGAFEMGEGTGHTQPGVAPHSQWVPAWGDYEHRDLG